MSLHTRSLVLVLTLAFCSAAVAAAQDIPEMSPEAAAAFADGMARYTAADYVAAAEAFAEAYRIDPSFAVAAFFEGLNWGNAGEPDRADDAYARAHEGRDRMSAYYRHRLAAQMAGRAGDRDGYISENRAAARVAPGSKAVYNVAQGLNVERRAREALETLGTLDPDRPPMKGWWGFWSIRHQAQHQVGDYEAQLRSAREARQRFPDRPVFYYHQGEALAALGRAAELNDLVQEFEQLDAPFDIFLISMAAEADAHGHPDLARSLLARAMESYAAMPADLAAQDGPRNWKAIAHYSRGEMAEADAIFRSLSEQNPGNNGWRTWVAVLAAERGDRAAAEAEMRRLLDPETAGNRATLTLYAATIATAMGDTDRFAELIRESRALGLPYSVWDHRHPVYRSVRQHPAYQAFTRPEG